MLLSRRRATREPRQSMGYPPTAQRLLAWYDGLTDRQRIQYAVAGMLFLLACGGYLLGLGSTLLLQRVEAQDVEFAFAAPSAEPPLAAAAAPNEVLTETAGPTSPPTQSPSPTPTEEPPTATPFAAPDIAEAPAIPRAIVQRPVAPAAPAAPAVVARPTPTASKPRNLDNAPPEAPAMSIATPTHVSTRPVVVATPVPTTVGAARPAGTAPAAPPSPQPPAATVPPATPAGTRAPTTTPRPGTPLPR